MEHGVSFNTFLNKTRDKKPTIVVVEDSNKYVFGGFCTGNWKIGNTFTGTGESFLFTLAPQFKVYHWTQKNEKFMFATNDALGMGGSEVDEVVEEDEGTGGMGLWLAADFELGSSGKCTTFDNECIASDIHFNVVVVEVWGLAK
eukprot:TRINITY_DN8455_c0_g1_i1.p1 TRINITY_DN8455_c0_g1~~TRINITY_DN8455_c0_g1_i1.p1  ORF type:complete len:144 (+),score=42.98 TRINITY_DN8455_c0_g1_i1:56-487(+)